MNACMVIRRCLRKKKITRDKEETENQPMKGYKMMNDNHAVNRPVGKKLHTKAKVTACYDCENKARKAEMRIGKKQ